MHYHYHWLWLFVLSFFSAVLLANLMTPSAPAAPLWGDIRLKHTWNSVPANWESLGPPPAGSSIDLYISLTPHRESALIDALYEVSDPRHKKYGAYLTKEQVAELVAPHQDTLEIVHSWLEHHGVPSATVSTSHGGGWLTITAVPVPQADELLCASYQLYKHTGTNETEVILRTVGYSLPAVLHAHVQTVAPTTHFASPRTLLQTPRKDSSEGAAVIANATSGELVRALSKRVDHMVTPSYLRWLYKTESYVPVSMHQNVIGTLGLTGSPIQSDLTRFMTIYRADAVAATFAILELNGGEYDLSPPGEDESIQLQYTAAMAYPTPQIFYRTMGPFLWQPKGGRPALGDPYLSWFFHLFREEFFPATISISSAIPESSLPPEYAKSICNLFAELGCYGVTIIVPSGDDGVGHGDCEDDSGKVQFIPMFPASCPWVTSVGGTLSHRPEVAVEFSGGGFSIYHTRPVYQAYTVPYFLEFFDTEHEGLFDPEGRGIPDVSAQANKFAYIRNNVLNSASSLSCSTATVAGIVSLLNDYLIWSGRPTLGFFNPLLYGLRMGINDITYGSNSGCNTNGFPTTAGWDPVTGLGTLDFEGVLGHLVQLALPPLETGAPEQVRQAP